MSHVAISPPCANDRPMKRRFFLSTLAAGSTGLLLPTPIKAHLLTDGKQVSLGCLGHATPAKYLDGRTRDGSVGLAPELSRKFPGTKWRVRGMGKNAVALECQGSSGGPRWLDGRTAHGTVGLAPNTKKPFTGTRWEIVQVDGKNPEHRRIEVPRRHSRSALAGRQNHRRNCGAGLKRRIRRLPEQDGKSSCTAAGAPPPALGQLRTDGRPIQIHPTCCRQRKAAHSYLRSSRLHVTFNWFQEMKMESSSMKDAVRKLNIEYGLNLTGKRSIKSRSRRGGTKTVP